MNNHEYSLNPNIFKNFSFDKYGESFTFIVDGRKYHTSRLVADLLSPIIRQNHYNDISNNEFIINTTINKDSNTITSDYFQEFLNLPCLNTIKVDETRCAYYSEYFFQIGNIEEYLKLKDLDNRSESNENESVIFLQSMSEIEKQFKINHFDETIQRHIRNISHNFSTVDEKAMKLLNYSFLEEIIINPQLQIEKEDELLDFIVELYKENRESSFLLENVHFLYVSETSLNNLIDEFYIEDLNSSIWLSICNRLVPTFVKHEVTRKRYKKSSNEKVKTFVYQSGKEFNGIMNFLTCETGGNIHDNKTIEIRSNTINGSCHPKNLVNYHDDSCYDPANSYKPDAFVCFDFKERRVKLTNYSIKSFECRHLKNWAIEASNNETNWIQIDRHVDDPSLNGENKICTFNISSENNDFYRFIKIHETGACWFDTIRYDGAFSMIEFFGQLQLPSSK